MTQPVAEPVRPVRPVTVTIAFWLQLAIVVFLLGLVGLVVAEAVHFDGQIDRAVRLVPDADPAEVAEERFGNIVMSMILGLPALLLAIWLAATALPVRRGGNTARILVFVAGGAQLLICFGQACSGGFLIPLSFAAGMGTEWEGEGPPVGSDDDGLWEESKFLETLYSGPYAFADLLFPLAAVGVLTVLLLTAAVVLLLALPSANGYFVPRAATPIPVGQYPMVPAGYAMPGYGVPAGYGVPPGYMICPDPALHLAPSQAAPVPAGESTDPGEPAPPHRDQW